MESKRERMEDAEIMSRVIGTKEWGEETIELATYEIERICDEIGASDNVVQVAKAIYRRSLECKAIEWGSIRQISSASVYCACRAQNCAFSPTDVALASGLPKKRVNKYFAQLKDHLGLEVGPVDPAHYVPRYVEELNLPQEVEKKSMNILEVCKEEGLYSGRSPTGIAAAAVYISSLLTNHKKTQIEVSIVSNVCVETIRERYQEQTDVLLHEPEDENGTPKIKLE